MLARFVKRSAASNRRLASRAAALFCVLGCSTYGALAAAQQAGSIAAAPAAPRVAAVSESLQQFVDRGDLAGAVALVARHGKLVHLDAVGYADVESRRDLEPDALFAIMSMTKTFTAVAALICCDEGKLALDDPIARTLPEFAHVPLDTITLRQAMSHTSGLFSDQRNVGSLAETVARLAEQTPRFAPGEKWMYSPGLTVAGRMVEVAAGMPFDEFVAARICQPLGMRDTHFRLTAGDEPRLATVYNYQSGKQQLSPAKMDWFLGPMDTRSPNPSGGLYSTVADLFRFYQMLLNGGALDGTRILKTETVAEMSRSQTGDLKAGFVPGTAYGLGVGVVLQPEGVTAMLSPGTFGHGGMLGTQAWVDPQKQAIMILLIQRLGLPNADASEYRQAFQQAAAAALAD
ncbi:MAG: beta-lactamase family protein [Pirellulales bacterium]|nr:beta-lactamase family protein [Pirellulales bacterium]